MVRPQQFSAVWTLYDGVHEWEELQFCLRFLRPGDHFVDVGANVGVFSALVGHADRWACASPRSSPSRRCGKTSWRTWPSTTCRDPWPWWTSAVSDTAGEATFEVLDRDVLNRLAPGGGPPGDGGGSSITVPVTTLDELV